MITFLECEQTCEKEDAAIMLKNKVAELQILHGKKACECHPKYEWKVAVDLTRKCEFESHLINRQNRPCDFGLQFIL